MASEHYSSVAKEVYFIVKAIRRWRHHLLGVHLQPVMDRGSGVSIYVMRHRGKLKNDKIQRRGIELSRYSFDVVYRASLSGMSLKDSNEILCHPGIVCLVHSV